ncbi:uncharacterized protein J3D65DRAFT_118343 [Phyllosticta citribraziliensis]|uniref:Uncharacterized protein n=1 Tax=Phyllosticta citribraziliensis TaxID=989973 RepID=A0ABR1LA58_9PEZI
MLPNHTPRKTHFLAPWSHLASIQSTPSQTLSRAGTRAPTFQDHTVVCIKRNTFSGTLDSSQELPELSKDVRLSGNATLVTLMEHPVVVAARPMVFCFVWHTCGVVVHTVADPWEHSSAVDISTPRPAADGYAQAMYESVSPFLGQTCLSLGATSHLIRRSSGTHGSHLSARKTIGQRPRPQLLPTGAIRSEAPASACERAQTRGLLYKSLLSLLPTFPFLFIPKSYQRIDHGALRKRHHIRSPKIPLWGRSPSSPGPEFGWLGGGVSNRRWKWSTLVVGGAHQLQWAFAAGGDPSGDTGTRCLGLLQGGWS